MHSLCSQRNHYVLLHKSVYCFASPLASLKANSHCTDRHRQIVSDQCVIGRRLSATVADPLLVLLPTFNKLRQETAIHRQLIVWVAGAQYPRELLLNSLLCWEPHSKASQALGKKSRNLTLKRLQQVQAPTD